jgi:hypothetical protein
MSKDSEAYKKELYSRVGNALAKWADDNPFEIGHINNEMLTDIISTAQHYSFNLGYIGEDEE